MIKKKLAIVALSLVTAFAGVVPAQAFPVISAPQVQTSNDVVKVQYYGDGGRLYRGDRRWRGDRGWSGSRNYYRNRNYSDRYYGGRNYRRYDRGPNVGAIIGGLAAGAIIGGALAQPRYVQPRRYVSGNSHAGWCANRYRSYRAYDNTFQPYNGPRQQCYSPYR